MFCKLASCADYITPGMPNISGAILGFNLRGGVIGNLEIRLADCHNFRDRDRHTLIVLTEAAIGSKITVQTSIQ